MKFLGFLFMVFLVLGVLGHMSLWWLTLPPGLWITLVVAVVIARVFESDKAKIRRALRDTGYLD